MTTTLIVALPDGLLIVARDGDTWRAERRLEGAPTTCLAADPQHPTRLYCGTADRGLVRSDDGGATWQPLDTGLRHRYAWGLAVDPADPDTVVISAAPGPYQAHNPAAPESAVYRRAAGEEWRRVTAGLPPERGMLASSLAADPAAPGVFYAANSRGAFRSPDTGRTWEGLPIPWPDPEHRLHVAALLAAEL